MSGVLFVVDESYGKRPTLFRWEYVRETPKRFAGADCNTGPHYRSIIRKDAGGVPEMLYRRTAAEAVRAYVDHCNEDAQRCRSTESALIARAKAAQALQVTP